MRAAGRLARQYLTNLVGRDLRAGIWVGLAFSTTIGLQWIGIALTGSSGGLLRNGLLLLAEAIAVCAAVYALCGQPQRRADWWGLPLFAICAVVVWLLFVGTSTLIVPVLPYHPLYTLVYGVLQLLFSLLLFPLLLLLPGASVTAPRATTRRLLGLYAALWWKGLLLWLLEIVVLTTAWSLLQVPLQDLVVAWVPFPALAALLVGAVNAVGWAIVVGRLGPRLRELSARREPAATAAAAAPAPALGVLRGVSAALAAAFAVAFLAGISSLQARAFLQSTLTELEVSTIGGALNHPDDALVAGSASLAEAYATQSVIAADRGDQRSSVQLIAAAQWWSPQDPIVERARAWLDVGLGGARRGDILPAASALASVGDTAGASQVQGLVAAHGGRPSRDLFFDALARDQAVEVYMPDNGPDRIAFTQDAMTSAATLLAERQRESFAQTAEVLDQHAELGATLAFDTTLRGLMAGSPGPKIVPSFYQDYASADASAHLLDPTTAHTRLLAAFNVATDDSQRSLAASSLMYVTVGRGIPDDSAPVVQWITAHDDSASRLGYATALLSVVGDRDTARAQLERVIAEKPDASTLSRADATLALLDYVSQDYQDAINNAKSALALNVSASRALAEAVEGNSTIGLAQAKDRPLAEAELRAAVRDNPYSFMTWYALARLDVARNDVAAAAQDDRKALVSYELVASAGVSTYAYVVNPADGHFYSFANNNQLDAITAALANDVQTLQRGAP